MIDDGQGRVGRWLLRSIVDRHDTLASLLDYVASSGKMFNMLVVVGSILTVLNDSPMTLFCVWYLKLYRHLSWQPSVWLVAIWESFTWFWVFMIVQAVGANIGGWDDLAGLLTYGGRLLVWVIVTYLMVELFQPPRKRKRLPLASKVEKPAYEGLIS